MKFFRLLCNYILRIINIFFPLHWQIRTFQKTRNLAGRNQKGLQIHILFLQRKMVGWAWLTLGQYYSPDHHPYGVIYSLAVANIFRRLGLGKMLIEQCIQQGKEIGLQELVVVVLKSNKKALLFYNKLGFTDAQKGLYPDQYALETALFSNTNYTAMVISTQHKKSPLMG